MAEANRQDRFKPGLRIEITPYTGVDIPVHVDLHSRQALRFCPAATGFSGFRFAGGEKATNRA